MQVVPKTQLPQADAFRARLGSPRTGTLALLLVGVALAVPWAATLATSPQGVIGLIGFDFQIYLDATSRWLGGGPFYLPHQIAGPYIITNGDVLYPPFSIYLFAPFLALPGVLWWVTPIGVVAAVLVLLRPSRMGLAVVLACLLPPVTIQEILKGNPVIWVVAFEALALIGLPTGPLVMLKASLFPFAAIGVYRRGWFVTTAVLALSMVPLAALVPEWLATVRNSDGGLLYSVKNVPLLLLPIAAWAFSPRRTGYLFAPGVSRRR